MIDLEQAIRDPSKHFATPADVLRADELSSTDKVRILRQWEMDARELAVAEEENMGGGETMDLDLVLQALHQLGEATDDGAKSPTKHGGSPC